MTASGAHLAALAGRVIGHVNLARGFRGGERQTELLVRELAARGLRQRLVARRGAPLAARCGDVDHLEIRETASQPVLAAAACRGTDLLHAHEARAIYACWLAGGPARPWLLTRRVDNPFKASFLRDRAYRSAAALTAVSRAIAGQIEARYPGRSCAVVPDAHANLAAAHSLPGALRQRFEGRIVIGHIGALDHGHKGQGTIIEAARLAQAAAPDLHFVLVGDGRDEAAFREQAKGLANIEFTGYVDNVADWLAVFDLFVFPSLHEGLGSTILDAMSFGLPVVATKVGGIPDIVADGENGLLIEPEAPEELLGAVLKVLDNPGLRQHLSEGARAQAARHGPDAMADRYVEIYAEILACTDLA